MADGVVAAVEEAVGDVAVLDRDFQLTAKLNLDQNVGGRPSLIFIILPLGLPHFLGNGLFKG